MEKPDVIVVVEASKQVQTGISWAGLTNDSPPIRRRHRHASNEESERTGEQHTARTNREQDRTPNCRRACHETRTTAALLAFIVPFFLFVARFLSTFDSQLALFLPRGAACGLVVYRVLCSWWGGVRRGGRSPSGGCRRARPDGSPCKTVDIE